MWPTEHVAMGRVCSHAHRRSKTLHPSTHHHVCARTPCHAPPSTHHHVYARTPYHAPPSTHHHMHARTPCHAPTSTRVHARTPHFELLSLRIKSKQQLLKTHFNDTIPNAKCHLLYRGAQLHHCCCAAYRCLRTNTLPLNNPSALPRTAMSLPHAPAKRFSY
jgi:hypothetical protein